MRAQLLLFGNRGAVLWGSIVTALAVTGGCTDDRSIDPEPLACAPVAYRIDAVGLPRSGAAAAELALDLDGDGTRDNRLGRLHATIANFFSDWRPDERLSERLATPAVAWLLTVARCDGALAIDLAWGRDADGDGRYELAPSTDGALGRDRRATGGVVELPLLGFTDALGLEADPGWVSAHGVAVELRAAAAGADPAPLEAIVGVGIDLDDRALAPVAGFLTRHLGDSAVARTLDPDRDGTITVAELRASPTVAALLAPDVDVDGADGVLDRVSLGFTVHAHPALTE